jgi:hypothetical protein
MLRRLRRLQSSVRLGHMLRSTLTANLRHILSDMVLLRKAISGPLKRRKQPERYAK